jgi:hypothetical protein
MKTEKEISEDIIKITMIIKEKYPELSKYLLEMEETIPVAAHPEVSIKILEEYYNSLENLLKKYSSSHLKS